MPYSLEISLYDVVHPFGHVTVQTIYTTNFAITYEDSQANTTKHAIALSQTCEDDFNTTTGWFGVTSGFGTKNRMNVSVSLGDGGGGNNQGYKSDGTSQMTIDAQNGNNNDILAAEVVRMIFVNEWVEILMSYNNSKGPQTWSAADSDGEGLSQLCGILLHSLGHYTYYSKPWVNTWLQSSTRTDWITLPEKSDKKADSFGCALLFLFYLKDQLGRSVSDIIQKGGSTLEATYNNLTGNTGANNAFRALIDPFFPIGNNADSTPKTPTLKTNDPFPLYGVARHELTVTPDVEPLPIWNRAFYIIAEGTASPPSLPGCANGPYQYTIFNAPKKLICTATTKGFGLPVYAWRINGIDVQPSGAISPVPAKVFVDDPKKPGMGTTSAMFLPINCALTTDPFTSTIILTFPSTVGHFTLTVECSATEKFTAPGTTSAIEWVDVATENLIWDDQYYKDREACSKLWHDRLERWVRVDPSFQLVLTLPDPPPEYRQVFSNLETINRTLQEVSRRSPEEGREIEEGVTRVLGITAAQLRAFAPKQAQLDKEEESSSGRR